MIDFKELDTDARGEALEKLARLLGQKMGLSVQWSGRGADEGKDLLFTEISSGPVSQSKIVWLVSCKDKARSGRSVSEDDLPRTGILDKLAQHEADGFLLITTTILSTGARKLLDSLIKSGKARIKVWDGAELNNLLLRLENRDLLRQFFPLSYERVSKADSLEAALMPFRDRVPDHVFSEVLRLIQPYTGVKFKGTDLWPYDSDEAEILDQIIAALLIERDLKLAVERTTNIGFDALTSLLKCLAPEYPKEHYDYLSYLFHEHSDEDLRFNVYQYLWDYQKLSLGQILEFAPWIRNGDALIQSDEVTSYALWAVSDYESEHCLMDRIEGEMKAMNQSYSAALFCTSIDPIVFQSADSGSDRIDFFGSFSTKVKPSRKDGSEAKSLVWHGKFEGFFNTYGIHVTYSSLD